jgi:hypothetical protein
MRRGGALQLHRLSVSGMQLPLREIAMIHNFVARIARFALPLAIASATGMAAAQTIKFSNSPGEAGKVTFSGAPGSLQTGTPISLMDDAGIFSWSRLDFSFQTGATADGWTFTPGGTVSMVATNGSMNGAIPAGTILFTGVLGKTTIYDQSCTPKCTGSDSPRVRIVVAPI